MHWEVCTKCARGVREVYSWPIGDDFHTRLIPSRIFKDAEQFYSEDNEKRDISFYKALLNRKPL